MYDIIGYIIYTLLVITGLLFLLLPGERLIDADKLLPGERYEKALKVKRILGAVTTILGIGLIVTKAIGL